MEGPMITLGTVLQSKAQSLVDALRKNLQEKNSVATRSLIQSIRPQVKIFGENFHMEIWAEDYWKYVEYGRKAGKYPPIDAIAQWITEKGLKLDPISGRRKKLIKSLKTRRIKKGLRQVSVDAKRRQAAFLIARKIFKKGIKPKPFVSETIDQSFIDSLKADISAALKKDYTIEILQAAK